MTKGDAMVLTAVLEHLIDMHLYVREGRSQFESERLAAEQALIEQLQAIPRIWEVTDES